MANKKIIHDNSSFIGGSFMGGGVYLDKRTNQPYVKIYLAGKQICISTDKTTNDAFRSKKQAYKALGLIQNEIDRGKFDRETWRKKSYGRVVTFRKYKTQWLDQRSAMCERGEIVPRTLKDEKTHIRKHIEPVLGDVPLNQISSDVIKRFHQALSLSNSSKYNVTSTLRSMLRSANSDGLILSVPEFPEMSKKSSAPKRFMAPDVQDRVIGCISKNNRAIFQVMRQYGLRPGEARALKWCAVRNEELHIERSFSENLLRETTKTGEARCYALTRFISKVIYAHPKNKSDFIFVRQDGLPYTSKNLNYIWRNACRTAEVPHMKLYNAMRHSLARNLLEQGHGFDLVAEVLGHASVEMTRSFYADMPMRVVRDALTKLTEAQNWSL